jgi:hypothetical protein
MQWNTIILPFSSQLWLAVAVVMATLTACLASAHSLSRRYTNIEHRDFGFPQAMFIVYAAVCQQGTWLGYWLHAPLIKQMNHEVHIICIYIVTCMCDYRRGFGLNFGFSVIANFHTLRITRARAKTFFQPAVSSLVVA